MTTNEHNGRVLIIDFGRGVAALLLVVIHSLWMYGSVETQADSALGTTIHMIGKLTASFLICMGLSFVLTRHTSLAYGLKRAVMILLAGYLLNALKFIVPISVFGTMPENFIEAYGWSSPLNGGQLRYLLLTGDILQMAGVSFLIITLIRHFITNKNVILALALLVPLFTELVRGYRLGVPGVDYVLDLLWGDQWNVYFPVFPWISCILVGMYMGQYYQDHGRQEQAIYDFSLKMGVALTALGAPLIWYDWDYFFRDFFHTGIGGTYYLIGVNLLVFWVLSWLVFKPLKNNARFMNGMMYLSKRVTSIYIIQWTLVCWLMGIIGYQTLNSAQLLMLFPVMIAATLGIDYLLKRLMELRRSGASVSPTEST